MAAGAALPDEDLGALVEKVDGELSRADDA
jgi:hypothetical protein